MRDTSQAVSGDAEGVLRAFLFADPAGHSRSPGMHNAAFRWAGLPGEYQARRVRAEDLTEAVSGLRTGGVLGANLSLPHKESVLPLLDDLTDAARAIGAVNTIIRRNGRLLGENTDAPGLLAALADAEQAVKPGGSPAVVLGAGGAARAAVYALRSQGREVFILNRTPEKARALAAALGGRVAQSKDVPWKDVILLVNSTSAGLNAPSVSPLPDFDFRRLPAEALVYDMVYQPAETRLMGEARAAGRRAENGLAMLAQQARLAFAHWTDVDVPIQVFLEALAAEGAA